MQTNNPYLSTGIVTDTNRIVYSNSVAYNDMAVLTSHTRGRSDYKLFIHSCLAPSNGVAINVKCIT